MVCIPGVGELMNHCPCGEGAFRAESNVVRLRITATGGGHEWIGLSNRLSITEIPGGWSSGDIGAVGTALLAMEVATTSGS